ncbi:hypothetical protein TYRP_012273 [Tyrophagus putrescentiae]|nr:hypothetical protein TYRP_012273 [Tyrophagus putrescentiae]
MLKAGVIWLIGTDGLGHNELASCVFSRRTMPINQMTSTRKPSPLGNGMTVLIDLRTELKVYTLCSLSSGILSRSTW